MSKRSTSITVRLTSDDADLLRQAAREWGISYAAVVRSALNVLTEDRPPLVGRTFYADYRPRQETRGGEGGVTWGPT